MRSHKFVRSDTVRVLRLGKKRPKLQKWRKPRGRHSKMRRKHTGYDVQPGIGYKQPALVSGLVGGKRPSYITSIKDLKSVQKGSSIVISRRIGAKKRIELLKQAHEMHITIANTRGGSHEAR